MIPGSGRFGTTGTTLPARSGRGRTRAGVPAPVQIPALQATSEGLADQGKNQSGLGSAPACLVISNLPKVRSRAA